MSKSAEELEGTTDRRSRSRENENISLIALQYLVSILRQLAG